MALFVGCFEHWREPSGKLANQADNYLSNDRNQFFFTYCVGMGTVLNCFNEKGLHDDCKRMLKNGSNFVTNNREKAKRFVSPETMETLMSKTIEMEREFKQIDNDATFLEFLIRNYKFTIEFITEKEWDRCAEVANVE